MPKNKLTHFDGSGQAHMVDVAQKQDTHRKAVAQGRIYLSNEAFTELKNYESKKGDVLGIARIAAIQATKQTSFLIPLCHPLRLTRVHVEFFSDPSNLSVTIEVTTETVGKTGVEMEAMTGVMGGLLTIYDMLKAVDKEMRIDDVCLLKKEGGKSGLWQKDAQ